MRRRSGLVDIPENNPTVHDRVLQEGNSVSTIVEDEPPMQTEFSFVLPRGYVDDAGKVHRAGKMRLATARDELVPLRDDRVRENSAYLTVVLLGRVITSLGTLPRVDASIVEDMFASDLAFLQDFYRRINAEGHTLAAVTCPDCQNTFAVDLAGGRLGE